MVSEDVGRPLVVSPHDSSRVISFITGRDLLCAHGQRWGEASGNGACVCYAAGRPVPLNCESRRRRLPAALGYFWFLAVKKLTRFLPYCPLLFYSVFAVWARLTAPPPVDIESIMRKYRESLPKDVTFTLRVVDKATRAPLSGITFSAYPELSPGLMGLPNSSASTGPGGWGRISLKSPGQFVLLFPAQRGEMSEDVSVCIPKLVHGKTDLGTVELEPGVKLQGMVTTRDGKPVAGEEVFTGGGQGDWGVSGPDGRFQWKLIHAGCRPVWVDEKPGWGLVSPQHVYVPLQGLGKKKLHVTVERIPAFPFSGRLILRSGAPAKNRTVEACFTHNGFNILTNLMARATSDSRGYFHGTVPIGYVPATGTTGGIVPRLDPKPGTAIFTIGGWIFSDTMEFDKPFDINVIRKVAAPPLAAHGNVNGRTGPSNWPGGSKPPILGSPRTANHPPFPSRPSPN